MAVIIPVPINTGAVTQAAENGHIGPALWQLVGALMILVCLPIMFSEAAYESERAAKRRGVLCLVLVFGVPTAVCIIAAIMGAPI